MTVDLDLISKRIIRPGQPAKRRVLRVQSSSGSKKELEWGQNEADMKLVYIAGNEEFTQGSVSYKTAIADALKKNISIC